MSRGVRLVASLRRRLLSSVSATAVVGAGLLLAVAAFAWIDAGAGSVRPDPTLAAQSRPNVIVVETDDQTVESMRTMRNVNSLIGAQGATFTNSFVNYSLCCPSRATFLTGQYAHNHDVLGNLPPNGGFQRFESLHGDDNLAVWLQDAGYHTALIGKYLNGYQNDAGIPPGWSEWHAVSPATQRVYNYGLNDDGKLTEYGYARSDFKQDVLSAKAVDYIDRRSPKAQPFFLWLTYTAPHAGPPNGSSNPNPPSNCDQSAKPAPRDAHAFDSAPLPRPPNFNEADVSDKPAGIRSLPVLSAKRIADIRRLYRCRLESTLSVDDGVKDVVDALRAHGDVNNTLLVFTSDNGFFHGEHRIRTGKTRVYEESIRVPLVMRGPGIPRGVRVDSLAINADLAPTIVDAANATPGITMDGRSLLPVTRNPAIENNRQLLIEEPSFEAIRTERYVYAEHSTGERELYDLKTDPYELQSRHDDPAYASVRAHLANRLHQLETCAGASCRLHGPDPAP